MYNVGPQFTRDGAKVAECPSCAERVYPYWDGHDGEWVCPACNDPIPDYSEEC